MMFLSFYFYTYSLLIYKNVTCWQSLMTSPPALCLLQSTAAQKVKLPQSRGSEERRPEQSRALSARHQR